MDVFHVGGSNQDKSKIKNQVRAKAQRRQFIKNKTTDPPSHKATRLR